MKNEKGITLISVTIYVIVMTIVIGVIAVVSGFFTKTIKSSNFDTDPMTEYLAFNSYFAEEVNYRGITILDHDTNYVVFDNGAQYTYVAENKAIYKNKVKIARNVDECTFTTMIQEGKQKIEVKFRAENTKKTTTYTLK